MGPCWHSTCTYVQRHAHMQNYTPAKLWAIYGHVWVRLPSQFVYGKKRSLSCVPWCSKEVSEKPVWLGTLSWTQGFVSHKSPALVSARVQGWLCGKIDLGCRACARWHMLHLLVLQVFCVFLKRWHETSRFNQSNYKRFIKNQDRCTFCILWVYSNYFLLICNAGCGYVCPCPRYSSKAASKMGPSHWSTSTSLKWPWGFSCCSDNAFAHYIMCLQSY